MGTPREPKSLIGSIVNGKYVPPPNLLVTWINPTGTLVFKLNPAVEWNGNAADKDGYYGRYAEGNKLGEGGVNEGYSILGGPQSERFGGESSAILSELLGRDATPQEYTDLIVAYGRALMCADWEAITGHAREGCVDVVPGGSGSPGQPRITSLSSPSPGVIDVAWQVRSGHTRFLVVVGLPGFGVSNVPVTDPTATTFSHRIEHVAAGTMSVTVTAFLGDTPGRPSLPKTVTVVAATDEPPIEPPPPPPVVEPPPQPAPPLPGPPHGAPGLSTEAREAATILRRKIAAGKQGKGGLTILIGPDYKPKLDALLDEIDRLP